MTFLEQKGRDKHKCPCSCFLQGHSVLSSSSSWNRLSLDKGVLTLEMKFFHEACFRDPSFLQQQVFSILLRLSILISQFLLTNYSVANSLHTQHTYLAIMWWLQRAPETNWASFNAHTLDTAGMCDLGMVSLVCQLDKG